MGQELTKTNDIYFKVLTLKYSNDEERNARLARSPGLTHMRASNTLTSE